MKVNFNKLIRQIKFLVRENGKLFLIVKLFIHLCQANDPNYIFFFLGTITVTEEEISFHYMNFVKNALSSSANDPINKLKVPSTETPGNKESQLAQDILNLANEQLELVQPVFLNLSMNVFHIVQPCFVSKSDSREIMWRKIHLLTLDMQKKAEWEVILSTVKSSSDSIEFCLLFHELVMQLVDSIFHHENEKNGIIITDEANLKLTEDEQSVIRYVGGYIFFSLIRKYKRLSEKKNSTTVSAALDLLESGKVHSSTKGIKGSSFLEFTNKWVELSNRGGLVLINDDVYIMIRRIENSVRKVFNVNLIRNYKGEDLRDVVQSVLQKDNLVNLSWDAFARNLPNNALSKLLKKQVIEKWVDIRARSFVNVYVQTVKRRLSNLTAEERRKKATLSTQSEVALRKKLS